MARYISPLLIAQEFDNVAAESAPENTELRIARVTRELGVKLTFSDVVLERTHAPAPCDAQLISLLLFLFRVDSAACCVPAATR